jgi:hypothetical protein
VGHGGEGVDGYENRASVGVDVVLLVPGFQVPEDAWLVEVIESCHILQ